MADLLTLDKVLRRGDTLQDLHFTSIQRGMAGSCISVGGNGYVRQHAGTAAMSVDVDGPVTYRYAGSYGYLSSSSYTVSITAADPAMNRIDILYLDGTGFHMLDGSPAAIICDTGDETDFLKWEQPYPASMSSQAGIPLAKILVGPAATAIVDANICMIGCPYVPIDATIRLKGTWSSGAGSINVGDWYYDSTTGASYECYQAHTASTDKEPGVGTAPWTLYWHVACSVSSVLYGTVAPTTEGKDGDFYIRTTTSYLYGPKSGGVWPAGISLIGAAGATGAAGTNGTNGTNGTSSTILLTTGAPSSGTGSDGDCAWDPTNYYFYGPKASGSWPAGTYMRGPSGGAGIWYGTYSASVDYPVFAQVSYSSGGVISSYIARSLNGPSSTIAAPTNAAYWDIVTQPGTSSRVIREVPTGTLNGVNCTFTCAYAPSAATEEVFLNGKLMKDGGTDYTLSSNQIIFNAAWATTLIPGAWVCVSYNH